MANSFEMYFQLSEENIKSIQAPDSFYWIELFSAREDFIFHCSFIFRSFLPNTKLLTHCAVQQCWLWFWMYAKYYERNARWLCRMLNFILGHSTTRRHISVFPFHSDIQFLLLFYRKNICSRISKWKKKNTKRKHFIVNSKASKSHSSHKMKENNNNCNLAGCESQQIKTKAWYT